MQVISVIKAKNGWKIEYEDRAQDDKKTPVKIKYPSVSDIGLGQPTREFFQALSKFLRYAIAIAHLDRGYWLKHGKVTGVKFREGKDDQALQIIVQADTDETLKPLPIATPFTEFFGVQTILQVNDPTAYSLSLAVSELEEQIKLYVAGKRNIEQLKLPLPEIMEQSA